MPLVLQGRYYNPEEAAETLGYAVVTINHFVRSGMLIPVHINKKSYLIPESEVERLRQNPPKMGRPRLSNPSHKAKRQRDL